MIKNKPEAYGISSDNLLCMVQELETFVEDIHSISVVCDNDVIFSKCIQPYTEEPMQMLHSFSKSMNSIAVGIRIYRCEWMGIDVYRLSDLPVRI